MVKIHNTLTMKDVFNLYSNLGFSTRLFVKLRHLLSPLEELEAFVPKKGNILDLGCGHGLFTNYMSLSSHYRNIIGIEPSFSKINIARKTESMVHNVMYIMGEIHSAWEHKPFDVITIVDVLYLLPYAKQKETLRACFKLLKPTGILIIKTQDTAPRWRFALTYVQEILMVKVIKLTSGDKKLYFLSEQETTQILEEAGFVTIQYHKLPTRIFYPNIVFVCMKDKHNN